MSNNYEKDMFDFIINPLKSQVKHHFIIITLTNILKHLEILSISKDMVQWELLQSWWNVNQDLP